MQHDADGEPCQGLESHGGSLTEGAQLNQPIDTKGDAAPPADDLSAFYLSVLGPLFQDAANASAFELACTLLRVEGLQMADWDSFQETRDAFVDYNWVLEEAHKRGMTSARRIGLLMYCQAVEMNAVHEILANLLRCRDGSVYTPRPLRGLQRIPKKSGRFASPPSAKQKLKAIKDLAVQVRYPQLAAAIERFFDERIRNAFSHSDYILTDRYFRFRSEEIAVEALDQRIAECFAFYGAFLTLHDEWLHHLGHGKRFHKWPNYEVLELLSTEEEGLYGFSVHFSNGTKATYMRRRQSGTEGSVNIFFDKGGLNFYVGQLELLETVWKVDGKPVEDWSTLP